MSVQWRSPKRNCCLFCPKTCCSVPFPEQIRRKDALVRQALEDKEDLVADMLSIPREHFQHIADIMISVDTSTSREPSERVLAAIFQVDQLQKAVNRALNVSESDQIALKGGKHMSCASQQLQKETATLSLDDHQQAEITSISSSSLSSTSTGTLPPLTIQVGVVRDIASSLSSELTTLLVSKYYPILCLSITGKFLPPNPRKSNHDQLNGKVFCFSDVFFVEISLSRLSAFSERSSNP